MQAVPGDAMVSQRLNETLDEKMEKIISCTRKLGELMHTNHEGTNWPQVFVPMRGKSYRYVSEDTKLRLSDFGLAVVVCVCKHTNLPRPGMDVTRAELQQLLSEARDIVQLLTGEERV